MANTIWNASDKTASVTLTGSNLTATASTSTQAVRAADRQVTGKFYWEVTMTTAGSNYGVGCAIQGAPLATMWATPTSAVIVYNTNGNIWLNNVNTGFTVGPLTAGGLILCIALDAANGLFWARNGAAGNWNGNASNNPATGTGGISILYIGGAAIPLYPAACFGAIAAVTANFGDTAFTGTVPSGFTSGFTAGATVGTSEIATQTAIEEWGVGPSTMQATQVAVEEWGQPNPPLWVTQVAAEHWAVGTPDMQLTQIAIEQWTTLQITYPPLANPTLVLSGSRAGIGSVVVSR